MTTNDAVPPPKNLLIIMVDQMRLPRSAYGDAYGLQADLKALLSFQGDPKENPWSETFPGFARLAARAVVLSQSRRGGRHRRAVRLLRFVFGRAEALR